MSKNRVFYLIYLTTTVFLILIVFEFLILPWYFKLPRDLALIGFTAEPNIVLDDTSINSMGFTGDVIDLEKNDKKIRILTLGGSAMFNRRMTEKLKDALNRVSGRKIEMVGAALRAHTSMSSVIKYRALSKYKFDYVIIYHGINDLFVNNVKNEQFKSDFSHMLPWYKRTFLLDRSLVARIIYNNFIWGKRIFGGEKIWYIYPTEELGNAMNYISEELFKRNMRSMVEEIKINGATPIPMTFAWSIPENYSSEAFEAKTVGYNNPENYDRYPVALWGSVPYVQDGLKRHNRVVRRMAQEHGVLLIDQEHLIGKNLHWFGDVCHLSEQGTDKFIQNITNYFLENNLF